MLVYLASAIIFTLLLMFSYLLRIMREVRKKEKSNEITMGTLHQWIVSNNRSVMQSLGRINEVMDALYMRTRLIDLMLRNEMNGEKRLPGQELQELESHLGKESHSFINETTHKDAIERIRSEDIHYYYATLIQELQQLNRQIGRPAARTDVLAGVDAAASGRTDANVPEGWYNRINKVV